MHRPRLRVLLSPARFVVCCCLVGVTGCSPSGPATGKVSGHITLDGAPVAKAAVTFMPQSGGSPAMGTTDESGDYKLTSVGSSNGTAVGKYDVTILKQELSGTTADVKGLSGGVAPSGLTQRWIIVPERYAKPATSGLSAEVKPGENQANFDLTTAADNP